MRMLHWAILILIAYAVLLTQKQKQENSYGSRKKQAPLEVLVANELESMGLPVTQRNIELVMERLVEDPGTAIIDATMLVAEELEIE